MPSWATFATGRGTINESIRFCRLFLAIQVISIASLDQILVGLDYPDQSASNTPVKCLLDHDTSFFYANMVGNNNVSVLGNSIIKSWLRPYADWLLPAATLLSMRFDEAIWNKFTI